MHSSNSARTTEIYLEQLTPETLRTTAIKCNSADRPTDRIDPKIDPKNAQKLAGAIAVSQREIGSPYRAKMGTGSTFFPCPDARRRTPCTHSHGPAQETPAI